MIVSAKTLRVLLSNSSSAVALKAMGSHADRFNMGRVDDPLHEWLYLQAIRDLNLVVEFNHSFITLVGSNALAESVSVHA